MKKQKILFIGICFLLVIGYIFNTFVSINVVKKDFYKIFNYYFTGDCEKYAQLNNISFSDSFMKKFGDTDWPREATLQKRLSLENDCKNSKYKNIVITKISKEKFSDTAFIQADLTVGASKGQSYVISKNFVMKYVSNHWLIDVWCDTEKDIDCK